MLKYVSLQPKAFNRTPWSQPWGQYLLHQHWYIGMSTSLILQRRDALDKNRLISLLFKVNVYIYGLDKLVKRVELFKKACFSCYAALSSNIIWVSGASGLHAKSMAGVDLGALRSLVTHPALWSVLHIWWCAFLDFKHFTFVQRVQSSRMLELENLNFPVPVVGVLGGDAGRDVGQQLVKLGLWMKTVLKATLVNTQLLDASKLFHDSRQGAVVPSHISYFQ